MDKRTAKFYVRLPALTRELVEHHAKKNLRTLNEDIIYLIVLGLHVEQFSASYYTSVDRDALK